LAAAGWKRRLGLVFLGALAGLALPPVHLVFLLLPAFAGLIWAVGQCGQARHAFMAGWWFGLGFGAVGYYWVGSAFLVDAATYGFLAPPAVAGLAAGMAVFPGLAAAALHGVGRWRPLQPLARILVFAAFWALGEWLRSWLLTGFPWNLIASVWTFSPEMIQAAAYLGPYGLSLVSVFVAGLPALFLFGQGRRRSANAVAAGVAVLAFIGGLGFIRLQGELPPEVDGVRLRLVQPNIAQHLKWRRELRLGHVRKQMQMSLSAGVGGAAPTHVIWAETAVPFDMAANAKLRAAMTAAVPPGGLLIAGAPRADKDADGARTAFNAIHAMNRDSAIVATYDKRHLVPFGEYVPLRGLLKFSKLTAGRVDFHPGTAPRVMTLPGLPPLAALICYEVIFPAEVADLESRPGWILNLTNDAWFGVSSGPHQHLAAVQLRAVELGLPVVRVANTGISAVIDAYGRLQATLPLGREGVLDSTLPGGLANAPPYGRFGDTISWLLIAGFLAAGLVGGPRRKSRSSS